LYILLSFPPVSDVNNKSAEPVTPFPNVYLEFELKKNYLLDEICPKNINNDLLASKNEILIIIIIIQIQKYFISLTIIKPITIIKWYMYVIE
jgi:hypothetical protein